MTKAIERAAQKQYPLASSMEQKVVGKFFDPTSKWTWYLMNQSPDDPDYLWGIVRGNAVEIGSFSLKVLQSMRVKFGLKIERDMWFKPMTANEVWDKLVKGEHV